MPDTPERPGLEVAATGCVTLVRLTAPTLWDEEQIQALAGHLFDLVEREGCRRLVVSLAAVEGFSVALLGKLLMLHKKAEAAGGRLALCGIDRRSQQALEGTELARLFHIHADELAAILALEVPAVPQAPP
jgi:anti-anti-sigma factor